MERPQIAIIDDEESVRIALWYLFRSTGVDATIFSSEGAFLAAVKTTRFECALLDLQMPGIGGLEVLDRLREMGSHLPVIVITGRGEPGSRESALAAGAVAYLTKPLDDQVLLGAVITAIALSSSTRMRGPAGPTSYLMQSLLSIAEDAKVGAKQLTRFVKRRPLPPGILASPHAGRSLRRHIHPL